MKLFSLSLAKQPMYIVGMLLANQMLHVLAQNATATASATPKSSNANPVDLAIAIPAGIVLFFTLLFLTLALLTGCWGRCNRSYVRKPASVTPV